MEGHRTLAFPSGQGQTRARVNDGKKEGRGGDEGIGRTCPARPRWAEWVGGASEFGDGS